MPQLRSRGIELDDNTKRIVDEIMGPAYGGGNYGAYYGGYGGYYGHGDMFIDG